MTLYKVGLFRIATIIQLVLIALQPAYCAFCPSTCDCQFDDKITDNSATCRIGNTTMVMNWQNSRKTQYRSLLIITCKGSDEFSCLDVPQFNVPYFRLKVQSCLPSLLKCIRKYQGFLIEKVETGNMIGEYTEGCFASLGPELRQVKLNLKDKDSNLPITVINELRDLKELYVNGGNLHLPPDTFKNIATLELMELKNNNISVLFPKSFQGLRCSKLHISNNNIGRIDASTFRVIGDLKELHIIASNLKYIEVGAFASDTLTHLRLEKNKIEFLPNGFLDGVTKPEELMFMLNGADVALDTHVFAGLPSTMKWVEFYRSKLNNLSDTLFAASSYLKTLKMHETGIEELPSKIFWDLTSLTVLSLSGNRLKYLPDGIFSRLTKLEKLNVNSNRLTTLYPNQFSSNPNLVQLLISDNIIATINMTSFTGTRLKTLTLLGNGLESITGDTSLFWSDMGKLDLANNKLKTFEDLIYVLFNLTDVDLSRNEITSFRENRLYFLRSNALLDLRRNKISHVIKDPNSVNIKGANISLYLTSNPLQCDCLLTTVFHEWNKNGLLRRFQDILCSDEQVLADIDAYQFCNKELALIALIGSSVIGSLIILIILFSLLSNRKKIWASFLDLIQREDARDSIVIEMVQDEIKPYDVFISFAHQDEMFVTDQLLPMLELDFGLKVCVHYRDWEVGELIPVQIKESVENSKITLIILTENFLESEWSYLEFRTAHDLSIEDGKPRVVLVLLDETITMDERLSSDLKLYVSINTYLLWNDQQFWEKLKKVLPKSDKRRLIKKNNERLDK